MGEAAGIRFGEFRVDEVARRLLRGDAAVPLRPKPWTLLSILIERAGQVVTRDEVARLVWPDVVVGDDSIAKAVRELRTALGDDARTPRYLETVHRIGLRFIGEVSRGVPRPAAAAAPASAPTHAAAVGRSDELAVLDQHLRRAVDGARQFVFVAGDGGIGKSTLVRAFLDSLPTGAGAPRLLFAQSPERVALAEAYAPLLDAVETLRRRERGAGLDELLRSHAPQWQAQLPGSGASSQVGAGGAGATTARMLREGVSFLEALAEERPVVLVLEDAHAADHATIDLLAMLAARPAPARILVVVTFRRAEAIADRRPVASMSAELELKGFATPLTVGPLDATDVLCVLELRLGRMDDAKRIAELLLARSGGNPLFLTALIDHLVESGAVVEDEGRWRLTRPLSDLAGMVPQHLRSLVDALVAPLPAATVEVLEAASVAGLEFDARAVAAALEVDAARVEEVCDHLVAEGRLLRFVEELRWNDGTRSACYAFLHQLYEGALYQRVSASRRRRLHLRVAERVEAGTVVAAARLSSELASHFLRGGNDAKAISYLLKTAERANRRGAHRDAVKSLRQALALFEPTPVDDKQAARLLRTQLLLAGTVSLAEGFVAPEVEALFEQARPISERLGALPFSFIIEFGLYAVKLLKSRLVAALESSRRLVPLAEATGLQPLRGAALGAQGLALLYSGNFVSACESFDRALELELDSAALDAFGAMATIPDLRSFSLCGRAMAYAILGNREAAVAGETEALARAATVRSNDRMIALIMCSITRAVLGDDAASRALATDAMHLVDENGDNPPWNLTAAILTAISAPVPELMVMQNALGDFEAAGYRLAGAAFRTIGASRLLEHGDAHAARALMDDPTSPRTTAIDPAWAAEQYRVRAELMAGEGGDAARAESLFRSALRVARQQHAKLWERRIERRIGESDVPDPGLVGDRSGTGPE